jgi:hypothetical protein
LRGHAAGDELLADLGRAWRLELRGSEALIRLRIASAAEWSEDVVPWTSIVTTTPTAMTQRPAAV